MPLSASGGVIYVLVSVHAGHISSINSDNVEPICHETNCSVKLTIFQFTGMVWYGILEFNVPLNTV